ncbi:MAG: hypothetical protein IJG58_03185, partial [Oscillospiraceae bacterium]|nr:hypothetical protein [Oscillospiraceae bacterium]
SNPAMPSSATGSGIARFRAIAETCSRALPGSLYRARQGKNLPLMQVLRPLTIGRDVQSFRRTPLKMSLEEIN